MPDVCQSLPGFGVSWQMPARLLAEFCQAPGGWAQTEDFEHAGDHDVGQGHRHEELSGQALELVLAEAGEGEPDPEDEERQEHHLAHQNQRCL